MNFFRQIVKSQLEKALFIVLVISLTLISGLFALFGGQLLERWNIDSETILFAQLGLFILCYFVLAGAEKLRALVWKFMS